MLKISGPAINTSNLELVNLATIKTYTQQTGTGNDTILQKILDYTHRQLYTLLGDRMVKRVQGTPWVYLLDGLGRYSLQFPQWPLVINTTTIKYGQPEDPSGTFKAYLTLTPTDWYADVEWGILYLTSGGYWPLGYHNIQITAEAGHTSCPEDLLDAICQWAAVKFERYYSKRWDMASITKEMETMVFRESEIPKEAMMIFRYYEREASGIA